MAARDQAPGIARVLFGATCGVSMLRAIVGHAGGAEPA